MDTPQPTAAEIEMEQILLAQRDRQQFEPLYAAYVDQFWKFATSRLGDRDRAPDVTSQTFVKAIQALPTFRPKRIGDQTSFPGWLMMIALNTIIDDQRRQRPVRDISDPAISSQLTASPTPQHIALQHEEPQRVRAAVVRLSPRHQQLIELRAAGFSGEEIAQMMGVSLNGVRTAH